MRTSSVFAIFCLSVGITASQDETLVWNKQPLIPFGRLGQAQRNEFWSIKSRVDEHKATLDSIVNHRDKAEHEEAYNMYLKNVRPERSDLIMWNIDHPTKDGKDLLNNLNRDMKVARDSHDMARRARNKAEWDNLVFIKGVGLCHRGKGRLVGRE
ncbi:hypothetical protein F5148DRAFT_590143 [Russula earlei]|uniref:Uncharacterized protein n=1 Tax=Russula earlei TaxID=71964 RepID=A0ACC0TXJ4_9AGAM|nr:hypothetical protein F5148DRAFT_590143 [Russula earlei]